MLQDSGLHELEERVLGFLYNNSGSLKLLSTLDDVQRLLHQVTLRPSTVIRAAVTRDAGQAVSLRHVSSTCWCSWFCIAEHRGACIASAFGKGGAGTWEPVAHAPVRLLPWAKLCWLLSAMHRKSRTTLLLHI